MKTLDIEKKRSYVQFHIGNENFAIMVDHVLEILLLDKLTHVPNASDYIMGILNFRGAIVPVINLNKRFNFMQHTTAGNMIIVVEVIYQDSRVLIGLQVEEVSDVVEFEFKEIRTVPDIGIRYNPEFLDGFLEMGGKFIMVLNVDKVLNVAELAEVSEIATVTE